MVVVDRVEHVVLHVPAERGEHHPDVEPGDDDALNRLVDLLEQAPKLARCLRKVVHIPGVRGVWGVGLAAPREP